MHGNILKESSTYIGTHGEGRTTLSKFVSKFRAKLQLPDEFRLRLMPQRKEENVKATRVKILLPVPVRFVFLRCPPFRSFYLRLFPPFFSQASFSPDRFHFRSFITGTVIETV